MRKHKLTKEDFERNPDLKLWGLKIGNEIGIPEQNSTEDGEDDDTGGSNPPPDKERPDRP